MVVGDGVSNGAYVMTTVHRMTFVIGSNNSPVLWRGAPMDKVSYREIERVARIYKQNKDVSAALDISLCHFARLYRHYGIETPYARRRRNYMITQQNSYR